MLRNPLRNDQGTAVVETALVSVLLLSLALGVVEFGNAYTASHTLTSLSREGANIAARGSSLEESVQVVLDNGAEIGLDTKGGVVATFLVMEGGRPRVKSQVATYGYETQSRVGTPGKDALGTDAWNLSDGQALYIMEVFYQYDAITPFGTLVDVAVPEMLYERAVFAGGARPIPPGQKVIGTPPPPPPPPPPPVVTPPPPPPVVTPPPPPPVVKPPPPPPVVTPPPPAPPKPPAPPQPPAPPKPKPVG